MNTKFIPISKPSITAKEINYANDALQSGWISSLGKYIDMFEERFANFCKTKYAVATCNGTVALHLSLVAAGINMNDEVIIPDFTFIATANAVKYTGAKVIPVDIDEHNLCIYPESISRVINSKTKAIIPVHIYGHPANMIEINRIAKTNNLIVIEDAAEAHGASINNHMVGGFGLCGIFSFYGNKIITTGEGGMITTNDENLYNRLRFLRDHGMSSTKRYWHTELAYNYRMTNIQGAIGAAQMERIDLFINRKIEIYQTYKYYLTNLPGISINKTSDWAKSVYWMVCLQNESWNEDSRNIFMQKLKEKGIDSRPYFYPLSDMPEYAYSEVATPVTHRIFKLGINLPSFYDLKEVQIKYICDQIIDLIIA